MNCTDMTLSGIVSVFVCFFEFITWSYGLECPNEGAAVGPNCYVMSKDRLPFAEALEACEAIEAELLWILEEREYRVLSAYLYDHMEPTEWLTAFYDYGGSSSPYHYLWKNHQPAYYVHWGEGEPGEPANRCATVRNDHRLLLTMADTPCSHPHHFICKIGNSSFALEYNASSEYNLTEIELPEETARKELEEFILEIKKDPDARTSAVAVGRVTLLLVALELACLILLDSTTITRDVKYFRKSLKAACRAKKKNSMQKRQRSKVNWNSGEIDSYPQEIFHGVNYPAYEQSEQAVCCLNNKPHRDDEAPNYRHFGPPLVSETSHMAASKAYLMSLMDYPDYGVTVHPSEHHKVPIPEKRSYLRNLTHNGDCKRAEEPVYRYNEHGFLHSEFRCAGCEQIVYCPEPDYD